ncbi:DnaJ-domain-containing protein [Atractiella rhizophila]|nr:DnaJ-domain-containing protein [Atractiella rhizophila]
MEANRDAASLALSKARGALSSSSPDLQLALRLIKKSLTLYETKEGFALLEEVEGRLKEAPRQTSASSNGTASTSAASARPNGIDGGMRNREKGKEKEQKEEEKKTWTKKQEDLVKRVRACKVTDYYKILELEKDCEEEAIKRAYKKLALSTHPDKNSAPGADEAFKMIGKAFAVLGDPSKRRIFDQTGSDPDSRGGGGGGGGFETFRRGGGMGGMGGEDLSPEDLFNFFFGGGMGGPMGGMGGGTTTFYGPGGIRFTSYGGSPFGGGMGMGGMPRRRPAQANGQGGGEGGSGWMQFLPLLALVFFTILSNISWFGGEVEKDLSYSFDRMKGYDLERMTSGAGMGKAGGVKYFVNSRAFAQHKIWEDIVSLNKEALKFSPKHSPSTSSYKSEVISLFSQLPPELPPLKLPNSLRRFEDKVETEHLRRLQYKCRREIEDRHERLTNAKGFLGIGADWDEVKRLQAMKLESCERLRQGGWRVDY